MSEDEVKSEDEVRRFDWMQYIREVFADMLHGGFDFESPDSRTERFLTAIWAANAHAPFDDMIEVIVDSDDVLFINDGVECERNEDIKEDIVGGVIGIPVKCYITMGDRGRASLRREDWEKIKSGFGFLDSCIFLGHNEYLVLRTREERGEQFTYLAKKVYYGLMSEETGIVEEGARCGGY